MRVGGYPPHSLRVFPKWERLGTRTTVRNSRPNCTVTFVTYYIHISTKTQSSSLRKEKKKTLSRHILKTQSTQTKIPMSLSAESLNVRRKRIATERVTNNGDPLVARKRARQNSQTVTAKKACQPNATATTATRATNLHRRSSVHMEDDHDSELATLSAPVVSCMHF